MTQLPSWREIESGDYASRNSLERAMTMKKIKSITVWKRDCFLHYQKMLYVFLNNGELSND